MEVGGGTSKESDMFREHCAVCGSLLTEAKKRRHCKFCSRECRLEDTKRRWRSANPGMSRSFTSATRGAISELRVCVDLMERGFPVFRALSSSCSCDLGLLQDHKLLRIEVTTGSYSPSGAVMRPGKDKAKFEILAIVLPDKIIYEPPLA